MMFSWKRGPGFSRLNPMPPTLAAKVDDDVRFCLFVEPSHIVAWNQIVFGPIGDAAFRRTSDTVVSGSRQISVASSALQSMLFTWSERTAPVTFMRAGIGTRRGPEEKGFHSTE